jgi:hypothetical protein
MGAVELAKKKIKTVRKLSEIPRFKAKAEEGVFWDTHQMALGLFKQKRAGAALPLPPARVVKR